MRSTFSPDVVYYFLDHDPVRGAEMLAGYREKVEPSRTASRAARAASRFAKQEGEMANKVENMVKVLREWQGIERQAMSFTAEISEKTDSTLIRLIMEIIRHDSHMHHSVQQFLIDSVTKQATAVTREDVVEIWESIEEHDALEKKTIQLAEDLKKDAWSPVHKLLLEYLLRSESLHDSLLEQLAEFKTDMSRASGA